MSKKSDDSIDRIFRQALTQYDTKFHEDDWSKMEKLLNEEAERKAAARSKRIKGTAFTLTGLTGLFIVVYFLAIKNPSGSIAGLSDSATEMLAPEALTDNGNVKLENPSEGPLSQSPPGASAKAQETEAIGQKNLGDATNLPLAKERTTAVEGSDVQDGQRLRHGAVNSGASADTDESRKRLQKDRLSSDETKARQQPALSRNQFKEADKPGLEPSNKSKPSLTPAKKAENVEAAEDKPSRSDDGAGDIDLPVNSVGSGKGTLNIAEQAATTEPVQAKTTSDGLIPELPKNNTAVALDSSLLSEKKGKLNAADSSSVAEALPSSESKSIPSSRWSVAFVIAPEFSTTKLTSYSSPGESFGLRIGYQLSNRFSVNTGLVRSQKKYEGSGEGYKPRNPAYWQIRTNGVVPEEIYSKCLVYELPLGLQFDAIQTSKSRLFISTAISSYLMINQAYDYTFKSPNPGADTGWRSRGSESYWFSVGMISAGYERYITRSFAIGIEPYLKISLSEIGWPNIKLYSTGAYVTLRYRFMSRRSF